MNETEQILLAQHDPQVREKLLHEHDVYIRRCASKAAGRFVDSHDDAYSEALIAFNDAVTAYHPDKGSFDALAAAAIRNRVTDLLRKESRIDAARRVKSQLVIDAVAKAEDIKATEEEINAKVDEYCAQFGDKAEEFKKGLSENDKKFFADQIMVDKEDQEGRGKD